MPLITDPAETRALVALLQEKAVAMPCFCTENSWTTQAILLATTMVGQQFGIEGPPVCVGFTAAYPGRSLLSNYLACGGGGLSLGFKAVLSDLEVLTSPESPYAGCRVLPVLDHGQPDADRDLLENCVERLAFVMFDGGELPFEENLRRTADYVERFSDRIAIEGAVAELKEAGAGGQALELTTPDQAERFLNETGCDLIVPNVGTEHRASLEGRARYHGERAREIADAVGPRLVLHGTSCLGGADLSRLPVDGFVKVNVWTIIERKGAEHLVRHMLDNLGHMLPAAVIEELVQAGALGAAFGSPDELRRRFGDDIGPRLDTFPLVNACRHWVTRTAEMLVRYFEMLGFARLAE